MHARRVCLLLTLLFTGLFVGAQEAANSNIAPPSRTITGDGTSHYIPIFSSTTNIKNSSIFETSGADVGIGTTSPVATLDVNGAVNSATGFNLGGVIFAFGSYANQNVFLGFAGNATTTGGGNIASGYQALYSNASGSSNTAVGPYALYSNTTGTDNVAVGNALIANTTGNWNTACGNSTLNSNTTGHNNTAIGLQALLNNTSGNNNTASGYGALSGNTTGSNNIAIGQFAANSVSGGANNNIHIGSPGSSGDGGVIRIGTSGLHNSFFVAGVSGITTGLNDAIPVMIDSNGQMGTASSSRRFKEDIQDMGEASRGLMRLRPVTFRYQTPFADGSKPLQYGLIAEEVAEVYPDLVARSADGQIETVKYHVLNSMLLNEVQRQQAEIQDQQADIRDLQERLARIEATLASMPLR
jgi:hypothetical protein